MYPCRLGKIASLKVLGDLGQVHPDRPDLVGILCHDLLHATVGRPRKSMRCFFQIEWHDLPDALGNFLKTPMVSRTRYALRLACFFVGFSRMRDCSGSKQDEERALDKIHCPLPLSKVLSKFCKKKFSNFTGSIDKATAGCQLRRPSAKEMTSARGLPVREHPQEAGSARKACGCEARPG